MDVQASTQLHPAHGASIARSSGEMPSRDSWAAARWVPRRQCRSLLAIGPCSFVCPAAISAATWPPAPPAAVSHASAPGRSSAVLKLCNYDQACLHTIKAGVVQHVVLYL